MKYQIKKNGNFTMILNSVIRNPRISVYAKVIYMLLRSYSPSFPSYAKILAETGIGSRTTVSKYLDELTHWNLLKRVYNSKYNSNLYIFADQQVDIANPPARLEVVQEVDSNKIQIIKTNNNMVSSPSPPAEDTLVNSQEILSKLRESLGTDASNGYKERNKPSFVLQG